MYAVLETWEKRCVGEGCTMKQTKGQAGTGDIAEAVRHDDTADASQGLHAVTEFAQRVCLFDVSSCFCIRQCNRFHIQNIP